MKSWTNLIGECRRHKAPGREQLGLLAAKSWTESVNDYEVIVDKNTKLLEGSSLGCSLPGAGLIKSSIYKRGKNYGR